MNTVELSPLSLQKVEGLVQVTKEQFFAVVGPLNVHPRPDVRSFKGRDFVSDWELQDNTRERVGVNVSDFWACLPGAYFLTDKWAKKAKETLP